MSLISSLRGGENARKDITLIALASLQPIVASVVDFGYLTHPSTITSLFYHNAVKLPFANSLPTIAQNGPHYVPLCNQAFCFLIFSF